MTIGPDSSLADVAFLVCAALDRTGQIAILTGGGAATVYAPEANQSRDADFVFEFWSSFDADYGPLYELGFRREGRIFVHPETVYTVDFPPGQLAIGGDDVTAWDTLERDGMRLHILTPTDCVRDRLAWFIQRRPDYAALEQALAVAVRHPIDLLAIERWAEREGEAAKFATFKHRYDEMMK